MTVQHPVKSIIGQYDHTPALKECIRTAALTLLEEVKDTLLASCADPAQADQNGITKAGYVLSTATRHAANIKEAHPTVDTPTLRADLEEIISIVVVTLSQPLKHTADRKLLEVSQ